ncbi:MAG: hypothetical protein J5781_05040, partial [Clostridia bacterium]|nr:hypothetical protein [Clostridia bacterium]
MKRYFNQDELSVSTVEIYGKKKQKIAADAILLIFICFLTLLALTTITFLKFGSESVLSGDAAFAQQSVMEETTLPPVALAAGEKSSVWELKNGELTEYEVGSKERLEHIHSNPLQEAFEYGVDLRFDKDTRLLEIDYNAHDDDGNVIYNSLGEPIILHYSEIQDEGGFSLTTVNMDEVYGLDGTEASVEEISEKMAANS